MNFMILYWNNTAIKSA